MKKHQSGLLGIVFSSFAVLIVKAGGGVAGFFSAALISRALGADQAGLYFLSFAVLSVLAVIPRLGLDRTVLRFISVAASAGDRARVSGILRFSLTAVFLTSTVFSAGLWLSSDLVAQHVFTNNSLAESLRIIALTIPLVSLSAIIAESLQGLHQYKASVFILNISSSAWLIIVVAGLVTANYALLSPSVCWVLFIACLVTLLHGLFFLRRHIFIPDKPVFTPLANFSSSCFPLYVVDVMAVSVVWSSQLYSGHWLESGELAHLAAAQRTATLTSLLLLAINTVTAPRFAALYGQGRLSELCKLAQLSTWAVTAIAVPVVTLMCLMPVTIMSVFGADFEPAARLLPILALGQLFNAITGSVGYLLVMSGHEKDMRNVALLSGFVALSLPLLLIPAYGAMGAVISSATALSLQNALALLMVRKRLGFWTFGISSILGKH